MTLRKSGSVAREIQRFWYQIWQKLFLLLKKERRRIYIHHSRLYNCFFQCKKKHHILTSIVEEVFPVIVVLTSQKALGDFCFLSSLHVATLSKFLYQRQNGGFQIIVNSIKPPVVFDLPPPVTRPSADLKTCRFGNFCFRCDLFLVHGSLSEHRKGRSNLLPIFWSAVPSFGLSIQASKNKKRRRPYSFLLAQRQLWSV